MDDSDIEFYTRFAADKRKVLGFNVDDLLDMKFYLDATKQTPKELKQKEWNEDD